MFIEVFFKMWNVARQRYYCHCHCTPKLEKKKRQKKGIKKWNIARASDTIVVYRSGRQCQISPGCIGLHWHSFVLQRKVTLPSFHQSPRKKKEFIRNIFKQHTSYARSKKSHLSNNLIKFPQQSKSKHLKGRFEEACPYYSK